MEIFNIHIEISLIIILNALFFSNFIIVLQQLAYSQEDTSSPTANEDSSQIRITSETKQVAFLIIIGVISLIIHKEFRKRYGKHRERQHFPVDVKKDTVQKQHHKCAICKNDTRVWDFDHKDGNRSNNRLSNCQALCPNCHAKKTRGLLKHKNKFSLSWQQVVVGIVVILFRYILYFRNRFWACSIRLSYILMCLDIST